MLYGFGRFERMEIERLRKQIYNAICIEIGIKYCRRPTLGDVADLYHLVRSHADSDKTAFSCHFQNALQ